MRFQYARNWGLAVLCSCQAPGGHAEAVKLIVGPDKEGQGWLFRDPATGFCGVVTAAHVVSSGSAVPNVGIYSARLGSGLGSDVTILSPPQNYDTGENGLDVAVMGVVGAIAERGCTTATLGASDVTALIDKLTGSVQFDSSTAQDPGHGELLDLPIRITARSGDERLGFRLLGSAKQIQSGYSGAPITELEGQGRVAAMRLPEAMVVAVHQDGTGESVRFDVIQRLVRKYLVDHQAGAAEIARSPRQRERVKAVSAKERSAFSFVESVGYNYDQACPPTYAVDATTPCGWRVMPTQGMRTVALVVAPAVSVVQHVWFTVLPSDAMYTIAIDTAASRDGDVYEPVVTRKVAGGQVDVHFLAIQSQKIRISVAPVNGNKMELKVAGLD